MLIGGNYTLCSLDSVLEYCFMQVREQRASIVAINNIPHREENAICQCLSSSLQECEKLHHRMKNGCYGYHMSITPFYNESINDKEAIIIANQRIEKIGSTTHPWLLLKEGDTIVHYHLITTVVYPVDYNYKELSFQDCTIIRVQRGQICPQKACGNLLRCRIKHGQIVNFNRLFDIALKFDFDNFTQFSSILRLQGIGLILDEDNKKLIIHPLYHPIRPYKQFGGERLYTRMMLQRRTKKRKNYEEDLLRVEGLVSEAFHLGVDFVSYLKEFGIIADLNDPEAPVYIDTKKRRVYEHRDFKEYFTLEKYKKMLNNDQWWRQVYSPLDKSYGSSLFPMVSFGPVRKDNCSKWKKQTKI